MMKVKTDTIIRTIVLAVALANQVLAILGKDKLPIDDDELYQILSMVVTVAASIWAWWKNNSFTLPALEGDAVKDQLKVQMRKKE